MGTGKGEYFVDFQEYDERIYVYSVCVHATKVSNIIERN